MGFPTKIQLIKPSEQVTWSNPLTGFLLWCVWFSVSPF